MVERPHDVIAIAPGVGAIGVLPDSRRTRHSGRGRASGGPIAGHIGARPAADRPAARRRRAGHRRGTRRPPRASAAGRSGRTSRGGSGCQRSAGRRGSGRSRRAFRRMKRSIGFDDQSASDDESDALDLRHAPGGGADGTTRGPAAGWPRSGPAFSPASPTVGTACAAARSRDGHGAPSETHRVRTSILPGLQLAGRGHLGPLVVDRLDQQALGRLARHQRRTRVAALEDRLERVEPQPALLLGRRVAGIAALDQERPDVLLEEPLPRRHGRSWQTLDLPRPLAPSAGPRNTSPSRRRAAPSESSRSAPAVASRSFAEAPGRRVAFPPVGTPLGGV